MIFFIIIISVILILTDYYLLIFPLLLITTRTVYLNRNIFNLVLLIPITTSLLVLLVNINIYDKSIDESFLLSVKIIATSFLLLHLFYGFVKDATTYTFPLIGFISLTGERVYQLIINNIRNTFYSFSVRRSKVNSLIVELRLVAGAMLTVFTELLYLKEEIKRLHNIRGSNLTTKKWVEKSEYQMPLFIADTLLFLVLLILVLVVLNPDVVKVFQESLLKLSL